MSLFSRKKTYATAKTETRIDTRSDIQSTGVSDITDSTVQVAKAGGDITFIDEGAVEKAFNLAESVSEREHALLGSAIAAQKYNIEAVQDVAATATENIAQAYAQAKEKINPQMILYVSLGVVALFGFITLRKA